MLKNHDWLKVRCARVQMGMVRASPAFAALRVPLRCAKGRGIPCPLATPFTLSLALSHRGRGDLLCSALALGIVGEGSCRCRAHPPGIPRSFRFARSRPFRVTKGAFRLEASAGGLDCFFDVLVGVG